MENSWAKARVLDASDQNYLTAVLPFILKAKREIAISLYLIEPNDQAGPLHPVNRLLSALLEARRRGVAVKMVLNTKFRVIPKSDVGLGTYFESLLKEGVQVTALLPNRRLHDKLMVIDGRYVVEGSTNWSISALKSNYESSSVIDSPVHARIKLERIKRILEPPLPRSAQKDAPLEPLPESIAFPSLLFEKAYLPRLIRESDRRTFDLYLILLGQSLAGPKDEFISDLETLGRALALPPGWVRSQVRRQMIKTLRKLMIRYRLLEAGFNYAGDTRIRLTKLPGETIPVPGKFLDPDFLRQESPAAVFLALAGELLKKERLEIDSLSAVQLEKRFGIGRKTILLTRSALKTRAALSTP